MDWIKGSRCGIDNCSSFFYQILRGQRVCQNGHVHYGLETTADDDEFANAGRKITRPRNRIARKKVERDDIRLQGKEARMLSLEIFQEVYKLQVAYVQQKANLPDNFNIVARELWLMYINLSDFTANIPKFSISLLDLTVLVYFSSRLIEAPLLLLDFNLMLKDNFPYFGVESFIDPAKWKLVPIEAKRYFVAGRLPSEGRLIDRAKRMRKLFFQNYKIKFPKQEPNLVFYKLSRMLMAPPQIYSGAKKILWLLQKMPVRTSLQKNIETEEEAPYVSIFMISMKLHYNLDGINRKIPSNRQGEQFNWFVWRDFMNKMWILRPFFPHADERLAMYWDDDEMSSYIRWYSKMFTYPARNKRLLSIFPPVQEEDNSSKILKSTASSQVIQNSQEVQLKNSLNSSQYFLFQARSQADSILTQNFEPIEQYAEHIPDTLAINELTTILHATTHPEKGGKLRLGEQYQFFAFRRDTAEELPEFVACLYKVVGYFMALSEHDVRRMMKVYERYVRHLNLVADKTFKLDKNTD